MLWISEIHCSVVLTAMKFWPIVIVASCFLKKICESMQCEKAHEIYFDPNDPNNHACLPGCLAGED